MTDINRRLQYNSTNQKQAKQAAEFLELDRQGKEIEEKGQVTTLEGISSLTVDCEQPLFCSRIRGKERKLFKARVAHAL